MPLLEYAGTCLSRTDVVTSQNRYNLVEREADKEHLTYLRREGIVLIAWSPLAKGVLTGKHTPGNVPVFEDVRRNDPLYTPRNLRAVWPVVEEIKRVAKTYGKTPARVALNWLIRDPWVRPILGAKTPEQVVENAGAVGRSLSDDDWRALDKLGWEASQKIVYVT